VEEITEEQVLLINLSNMAIKLSQFFNDLASEKEDRTREEIAEKINKLMEAMDTLIEDFYGDDEVEVMN
jgi:hypothetical protein